MARYHGIAATSNAIRLLLENAAATSEWSGGSVELYQADQLQKPLDGTKPKISVYLYRVLLSTVTRRRRTSCSGGRSASSTTPRSCRSAC